MKYYCIPDYPGREPAALAKRKNAYQCALAREAEPGVLFDTREEAERRAAEVIAVTKFQWTVKEVDL